MKSFFVSSRQLAGLLFGVFSLFVLGACSKPGVRVETSTSSIKTLFARVTESGLVQPTIDVPVAPDVSGEVVDLQIIEGKKVKKGELLLTIRPDDYRAQLEQAEASMQRSQASYLQAKASVSQAKATLLQDSVALQRTDQLFREKVVSKVELENAQLKYQVSKSQYEAAKYSEQSAYYQVRSSEATRKQSRQNLDRTNIYASMDGTITKLNIELGQRVVGTSQMAGTEILKIADLSSMEVLVEVNENDIINVSLGDSSRIEVDAFPDKIFYGQVTEIAYSATVAGMASTDQVTNFEVKVKIDPRSYPAAFGDERKLPPGESPFRPGMTALVEIYTQQEADVVVVPIQAVSLRAKEGEEASAEEQQEVVFRLNNNTVEQVSVKTGISDNTHIHILSGLEADQTIVTGPFTTLTRILKDGMEVEVGK
jgi:HlyD family secretion protein